MSLLAAAWSFTAGGSPVAVFAAGVYEDVAGEIAFLYTPQARSLSSTVTWTDGEHEDASVFTLSAAYPLRPWLLVAIEQSYITVSLPTEIASGFGDLRLRARAGLFARPGRAVRLISGLRAGSGTTRVYPYASQSVDIELALGYVDTLEFFRVHGALGGALVKREPKGIPDPQKHENFARLLGGLVFPLPAAVSVSLSVAALAYRSGNSREIYAAGLDFDYTRSLRLYLAVQAEAGRKSERVSDYSAAAGVRVLF